MVFEEKQTMPKLMWVLFVLPVLMMVLFFLFYTFESVGERDEFLMVMALGTAIEAIVAWLFYYIKLNTKIDQNGISFRLVPFILSRQYNWQDIEKVWVRKYSPVGEYGGWGIRSRSFSGKNMAYNVWGNKGLQIHLKNGKKILIGTQKPEEMAAFLKRLKEKHELVQIDEPQLNG